MRMMPAYVMSCTLFASAVEAFLAFLHHYSLFYLLTTSMYEKKRRQRELVRYSNYCCDSSFVLLADCGMDERGLIPGSG